MMPQKKRSRIRIQKPLMDHPAEETIWKEVRKYVDLMPQVPEPNLGRVREIKDEIKKGTYLTPEVIEETAARLSIRFMRPE